MATHTLAQLKSRLNRMLGFLESDPRNPQLLTDAAYAAFDEGAFDLAQTLLVRRESIEPPSPSIRNLSGLIAMAQQRFDKAVETFEDLHRLNPSDPAIRFNCAWAKAMTGAYQDALLLLDDEALSASPKAPALKVQMMHHLERYEDAIAGAAALASRFPDNEPLMGSLACLMLDAERPDLAEAFAQKAKGDSDGQTALGMLALGHHAPSQSLDLFDEALNARPENPRAWIGKGLSLLVLNDPKAAAQALDRGAEIFGDHVGSWVASGWAWFVARDYKASRERFERARARDPNFAESHGGLAVLDVLEGRLQEAEHGVEIALRLNRTCFGATLAKSLLLERGGHPAIARRIVDLAMSTPIGLNGETISQAVLGFSRFQPRS